MWSLHGYFFGKETTNINVHHSMAIIQTTRIQKPLIRATLIFTSLLGRVSWLLYHQNQNYKDRLCKICEYSNLMFVGLIFHACKKILGRNVRFLQKVFLREYIDGWPDIYSHVQSTWIIISFNEYIPISSSSTQAALTLPSP